MRSLRGAPGGLSLLVEIVQRKNTVRRKLLPGTLSACVILTAGTAMTCVPLPPSVVGFSNSGCLQEPDDGAQWPCDEDEVELTLDGNTLHVVHRGATYNCCAADIVVFSTSGGDVLRLTEEEILISPCFCTCCYDVEATVVGFLPGTYTVEYCWEDYELGAQCHREEIVVP